MDPQRRLENSVVSMKQIEVRERLFSETFQTLMSSPEVFFKIPMGLIVSVLVQGKLFSSSNNFKVQMVKYNFSPYGLLKVLHNWEVMT